VALAYGSALLRVRLQEGTRLVRIDLPHDPVVMKKLQRKFGKEVLSSSPWKVVPERKKLELGELVNLARFHFRYSWAHIPRGSAGPSSWPKDCRKHLHLLGDVRRMLIRYGIHGFGEPDDYLGFVIFSSDRVRVEEVVAIIPWEVARTPRAAWASSLSQLRVRYGPNRGH
jgi:hypothetical protein